MDSWISAILGTADAQVPLPGDLGDIPVAALDSVVGAVVRSALTLHPLPDGVSPAAAAVSLASLAAAEASGPSHSARALVRVDLAAAVAPRCSASAAYVDALLAAMPHAAVRDAACRAAVDASADLAAESALRGVRSAAVWGPQLEAALHLARAALPRTRPAFGAELFAACVGRLAARGDDAEEAALVAARRCISRSLLPELIDGDGRARELWAALAPLGADYVLPPTCAAAGKIVPAVGAAEVLRVCLAALSTTTGVAREACEAYTRKCALYLVGVAGGLSDPKTWSTFAAIWEALETHSGALIRPAWARLESLALSGALPREWVALLAAKAIEHFHAPVRRGVLHSFLSARAELLRALIPDIKFVEGPVMFRGELHRSSLRLVSQFLDRLFEVCTNLDRTELHTVYMRTLVSRKVSGAALMTHLLYMSTRERLLTIPGSIALLTRIWDVCAATQHHTQRDVAASAIALGLPRMLAGAGCSISIAELSALLCSLPRRMLLAQSTERAAVARAVRELESRGPWLASGIEAMVTDFLKTPLAGSGDVLPDECVSIREHAQKIALMLSFFDGAKGLCWSDAALAAVRDTCSKVYSHTYLPRGAAEKAVALLGLSAEYASAPCCTSELRNALTRVCDETDKEVSDYIDMKLKAMQAGYLQHTLLLADCLSGKSCGTAQRDMPRRASLLQRCMELLRRADATPIDSIGSLASIHAIVVRGGFSPSDIRDVFDTVRRCPISKNMTEPKSLAHLSAGRRWIEWLDMAVEWKWEVVALLAPAVIAADSSAVSISDLIDAVDEVSTGLSLCKLLDVCCAVVGVVRPDVSTIQAVDNILMRSFRMMSDISWDSQALAGCASLAFSAPLVAMSEYHSHAARWASFFLDLGERITGISNLVSHSLLPALATVPHIAHLYVEELIALAAHGPSRGKSYGELCQAWEEAADVLPGGEERTVSRYFDMREIYTRVELGVFVRRSAPREVAERIAIECAKRAMSFSSPRSSAIIPLYSHEHRTQLRLLQAVCAAAPRCGISAVREAGASLRALITYDCHAVSRLLASVALTRLAISDVSLVEPLVDYLKDAKGRTPVQVYALSVLGHLCVNLDAARGKELFARAGPVMYPHLSGGLNARTLSQIGQIACYRAGLASGQVSVTLQCLERFFFSQDDAQRIIQGNYPALMWGKYLACDVEDVYRNIPCSFDNFPHGDVAPVSVLAALDPQLLQRLADDSVAGSFVFKPICPDGVPRAALEEPDLWGAGSTDQSTIDELQRKPEPWEVSEAADETRGSSRARRRVQDLVLVASLVDRPPNLGGMCRLSDIFGVREYVVPDLRVRDNGAFQTVSVTSERWVPMVAVGEPGLPEYLARKRAEGYTLFGVEQTSGSVPLQSVKFPQKSLLILGKEAEGLPAPLIALLDACIEVPQFGVVRSLNVHVTAALVVWEYTKQHACAQ
eukprot:m51a1_g5992 putative probable methyltransferase tarbp1-like (1442) ;mRNA; f:279978-284714